ncbi:unnamed protein product, partial [Ectocarpus sp. 12 AP-2014]
GPPWCSTHPPRTPRRRWEGDRGASPRPAVQPGYPGCGVPLEAPAARVHGGEFFPSGSDEARGDYEGRRARRGYPSLMRRRRHPRRGGG